MKFVWSTRDFVSCSSLKCAHIIFFSCRYCVGTVLAMLLNTILPADAAVEQSAKLVEEDTAERFQEDTSTA